jgi:hypothetical protein
VISQTALDVNALIVTLVVFLARANIVFWLDIVMFVDILFLDIFKRSTQDSLDKNFLIAM